MTTSTTNGGARTVRLTIPAKAEYITLVRLALSGLSQSRELSDETLGDLKLALTEACSNSVRHAYAEDGAGSVDIVYELHPDRLVVEVCDDGPGFSVPEPTLVGEDDELEEGGLGIAIIRALTDEVEIGERDRAAAGIAAPLREVHPELASIPGRIDPRRPASSDLSPPCSKLVNVGHKSLADYATIATRGLMDEIRRLAEPLAGKRVAHVSATAFGGGVAEINYTLVPLKRDAGLDAEWRIIQGADEFFAVTKTIHNALQGDPHGLTKEQQEIFRRYNALNAEEFEDDYDFVIVHDPQPAAMIDHFPNSPRAGSGAATSTSRRRTRRCSTSCCRCSSATTRRSSTCPSTCRAPATCRRRSSGRRRSTRWRRRTWRSRPRTPRTSSTSSGSTSSGRC